MTMDEAFEEYRAHHFGAYNPWPIDACTYFCAGWHAAVKAAAPSPDQQPMVGKYYADYSGLPDQQPDIRGRVIDLLHNCENDFHVCSKCGEQDDEATKTSNLYLLLKSMVDGS